MVLFLYGEDTYRSLRKLGEIRAKFLHDVDPSGLNVADLDARRQDLPELQAAVASAPFLAPKRLVVARHFLAETPKKESEELAKVIAAVPDGTILVLFEDASAKDLQDSLAFAALKGTPHYPEFAPLSGRALADWIRAEARARGLEFEKAALDAYVAAAGPDLWRVAGELDKLAAYSAATGTPAGTEALQALTDLPTASDIFGFTDAVGAGDAARAAELLETLLQRGETEVAVLNRLQSHVRSLLLAADLAASGPLTRDRLAKELGLHPFVAGKVLSQVRHFDREGLKRAYASLIDADIRLKTGGWSKPRLAIDIFLLELAE